MESAKRDVTVEVGHHASELLDLGDAFFELDRDWRIIRVNRNQEKLSQKPREETLGRVFWEVWPETAVPDGPYWHEYHRCMEERVPVQFEAYFEPLDLWTGVTAYPVSATGGIAVFFRDVSAEKRAEQALRAEHGFTAAVLETVANVVVVLDAHGLIVRVNAACRRLTGYTADELIGRAVFDVFIPEDELPGVRQTFQKLRAGQFPNHYENRWRMKDGSERTLAWDNTAILDRSGEVEFVIATGVDVTDRRRDEQRLRESEARLRRSEERLRLAQQIARIGTFEYLPQSNTSVWTPEMEALHGLAPGSYGGTYGDWAALVHPDDLPKVERRLREAWETGAFETEWRIVQPDGVVRWLAGRGQVLRDDEGRPAMLIGVNLDITDIKRGAEALRASEARHRAFFQSVMELAGVHEAVRDPSGAVVDSVVRDANEPALRFIGKTRDEVIGRRLGEFVPPALVRALTAPWTAVLDSGAAARYEVEYEGHILHVSAARMSAGTIAAVADDITDSKRAEEALRESEARARAVAENIRDLLVVVEAVRDGAGAVVDWRYAEANPAALALLSRAREEVVGRTISEVLPDRGVEVAVRLARVVATGAPEQYERTFCGRTLLVKLFRIGPDMVGSAAVEITERKRAADALERANDALREADRRKDEFLGMLSHELRNPLAPIRNALYILDRAAPAGEQARRAKEVASRQIAHLTRLVDDLLDVTRIGRGKVELRRADVDLGGLANRIAEDHRVIMQDRRLDLEVQVPTERVIVNADATRLAQVLGNLLHNAAKFTPAGGHVTLAVAVEDGRAVIRVRDTGPGIAPEVLPTIFEPFTQGKQTLARTEGGLGLGLALVKGLVAMHGGEVRACSAGQGGGAEFVVTLPLATPRTPMPGEPEPTPHPPSGRRRVLVIDDNRDAADTIAELVAMLGHEVDVAYDAYDGIAKATAVIPDVVFCDIGLPGMDGFEFARQLRALAAKHRVRLVALSGYAQPEDVARAIEAGFDAHVAKPPNPEALAGMLG